MGKKKDVSVIKMIVEEMVVIGSRVVCDRNQIVYEKGAAAEYLYILEQGYIEFIDKEVLRFSVNHFGDVFGWASLSETEIYMNTAISRTISSVIQIPKDAANDILFKHKVNVMEFSNNLEPVFENGW
ncbi:MAG: cyclic nucleotide-binding domain-containing protein [Desulfobacterales bacterium]|nr:cyclic nucleotide-binding domain-containing protein [Desulfobacterales bacterium]